MSNHRLNGADDSVKLGLEYSYVLLTVSAVFCYQGQFPQPLVHLTHLSERAINGAHQSDSVGGRLDAGAEPNHL